MISFTTLLLTILTISNIFLSIVCADCNSTHYQFYSKYSLGKQQQLNQTFSQLQSLIMVPTISYTARDYSVYNLTNIKIKLRYIDSKQKAAIIGRDTVAVYGGIIEVFASFNWVKQSMIVALNGTGQARILSGQIMFQKNLVIDQGYLDFDLGDYYNISFQFNKFILTRIDPANTAQSDIDNILNALNNDQKSQSLKGGVEKQLNHLYPVYLRLNLKNQHYPLDDHFSYIWTNPWTSKVFQIPFMLIPTGVDLQPVGLSLTFVAFIKDDSKWKCGKAIPSQQLNPDIYGGLQQFISFSVWQNTIRYALQKGMLNTVLNRRNWQSKFFQFFAGDLYEIIPQTANNYLPTQSVLGNCTYNPMQQPQLSRFNSTVLKTTTAHTCIITIQGTKLAQFNINLNLQVSMDSNDTYINFKIITAEGTPVFKQVPDYTIKNKLLAEHMVLHSLNRLKQGWIFGSGWKIYPRDYSHVIVEDEYVIIYDSTHVQKIM